MLPTLGKNYGTGKQTTRTFACRGSASGLPL
jgi:hypothetical protein